MLREVHHETGTVTLNYAAASGDGPPLLLIHGVTSRWQGWLPVAPALAVRWRLLAPDLRGHGRSGRAPGAYTIDDYAGDIVALLRDVLDEPAVIVGHSLGGIIATAVAATASERVAAVVLEDPPLGAFRGVPFRERPERDHFVGLRDLALEGHTVDELVAIMGARGQYPDQPALRRHATQIAQLDPDVLNMIVTDRAVGRYDQDACLRAMVAPTLLLQSDPAAGGALGDAEADAALALLPQGTLVRLPGIGHGIHADIPERFARIVHDFLESR